MSLMDTMMEEFVMMDRVTVPDGMGGFEKKWTDGSSFQAAVTLDSSMEARIAEKQGVTEVYTVTVDRDLPLYFHDVFRRVSDGAIFRVTSNITDKKTPKVASFEFGQVTAERIELTND